MARNYSLFCVKQTKIVFAAPFCWLWCCNGDPGSHFMSLLVGKAYNIPLPCDKTCVLPKRKITPVTQEVTKTGKING